MLELNLTFIVQIIAYFVLLYLLNRLLYRPVMEVIEERKSRTKGTLKQAADTEDEVEKGLREYRERLKEETVKAQESRASIKQEAFDKEKILIEAARRDAQAEVARIKEEVGKSKLKAEGALKKEAKKLSMTLAEKILERGLAFVPIALGIGIGTLVPSMAFAEAGGEQANAGLFWRIFNFLLLAAMFYLIWKKWIRGYLETRGKDIHNAIEEASRVRAEAEAKLKEYKQKLALLDKRIEQIHNELGLEAAEEKKRILMEAEDASSKIREQARLTAGQEIKKAKIELQKEVARLAVELAEEVLAEKIKPEDQKRLLKDYIGRLDLS